MVFSSLAFICVFLPVVFLLHLVLPNIKAKNALLIVASLVFYAYGEPVYVLLMLASTIVNWALGLAIGGRGGAHARRSRAFLVVAIVANLGMLGVFKYAGMAVSTVNALFGINFAVPAIALPVGVSFYTFQALSYDIDVYRGDVAPQRSYARVLLYISFFPQLIAGPIVKYHDVAAQLESRRATLEDISRGFLRFCVGLGKKVLIANTLAVGVDAVFAAPLDQVNIVAAWVAAVGYLLQIYFDFSGYSDMAIGMARMFGFHFKENFNYPYSAKSVKEFWRRWHISLSTWFKEYLYIPLGGNRKGRPRTVLNKIIVFFLCGLWHGASWTFVIWGLLHGFFLLLEEYVPIRKLPKALGLVYTLLVVTLLFVVFRADTIGQAWVIIAQMFTGAHFDTASMQLALSVLTPSMIAALVAGVVAAAPIKPAIAARANERSVALRACMYVGGIMLLVACITVLSVGGYNPFIYFRF